MPTRNVQDSLFSKFLNPNSRKRNVKLQILQIVFPTIDRSSSRIILNENVENVENVEIKWWLSISFLLLLAIFLEFGK